MKGQDTKKYPLRTAIKGLIQNIPMLFGVIGLVGIFQTYIKPVDLEKIFSGSLIKDMLVGTFVGAISAGQPIVSYIIGGELLKQGISMFAVAAFIIAWVTLGIIQLPLEVKYLGKTFTFCRNILALIFVFIVSVATVVTMGMV